VIDFVGIFERLEAALAFDSDVVASVITNLDVLKSLFAKMLAEQGRRLQTALYKVLRPLVENTNDRRCEL
jgi:type I restriction enzyme R subunit